MTDRCLVALQRAPRRALAAPAESLEEAPDVAGMVTHATRLLDQLPDAPRRPEFRVEAERFGAALKPALNSPQLCRHELGLPPRAPRELQARAAADEQLPRPPVDRLAMYAHLARDLRLRHALPQQRRGAQPPRFERCKIPPHPRRIPHAGRIARCDGTVTIL